MPGPQIWAVSLVKIVTKLQKSTDHDPELISTEGGQDTSACKISGHSLHAFFEIHQRAKFQAISSIRSPGNARKPQIWPVSLSQNSAKIRKMNRPWPLTNQFWRWSRYISMQNFRPFPPCVPREMPGNPKFDPFHYVKIAPKLEKSTDHSHKLTSSEDGQDTSASKISGQSLHAFSGKCPETSPDGRTDRRTDGRTDGHAVKRLRLVGWTKGPMYRSKEGISGFGRTNGRTDNPKT